MTDMLIVANHMIRDNLAGLFEMTNEIDQETGEYKVRSIPRITPRGAFVNFPEDEARRMIELGAAHEPDERELALYNQRLGAIR